MLHTSCKNAAKGNDLLNTFAKSQEAHDYSTSTTILTQLFALDSIQYAWAVDTLAYYHFINAKFQSDASELLSAAYFIQEGLIMDPNNKVLNILDADVKLLNRKDTAALEVLQNAYNRTKDEEFMYYLAAATMATGRKEIADSIVNVGLNSADSMTTRIQVQDELNRSWQSMTKKAVYLFLKANYVFNYEFNNDRKSVAKGVGLLNECLRIEPDYTMAKAYYYQIQQQLNQNQNQGRY